MENTLIKHRVGYITLVATVLAVAYFGVSGANAAQTQSRVNVFISFDSQPGPAEEALVRNYGGNINYTYTLIPAISASVPQTAIEGLSNNPHVTAVEEDGTVEAFDTEMDNAWGVKRIGSENVINGNGNGGAGISIAIIDSGINYNHPDLNDNYKGGYDFVQNDADPMDVYGHGTHVAGTACAEDNDNGLDKNGKRYGVVGVAPKCDLYALRVLDDAGISNWSRVVAALQWAVDNNINVANLSLGEFNDPGSAVHAAFDNAEAAGVFIVAATGNRGIAPQNGSNVSYPAAYGSVVAVGATDANDNLASISSTGPETELAAPGELVYSTWNDDNGFATAEPECRSEEGIASCYKDAIGTSMAAPHVAGAAALVLSNGTLTDQNGDGVVNNRDVRIVLQNTAEDLGDPGRDDYFGYGLVNVAAAAPLTGTPPTGSIISPTSGSTATGTERVFVQANDDTGVQKVELSILDADSQICENHAGFPTLFEDPSIYHAFTKHLQEDLMFLGYNLPLYGADGYYGSEVESAVSSYKSDNGLGSDGTFVDTLTWNSLESSMRVAVGNCVSNSDGVFIDITSNFDGSNYYYDWNTTLGFDTTHELSVRITDLDGRVFEPTSTTVYVDNFNSPPVADAGPDQQVQPGVNISFDGSGSYDPDGTITDYSWDFGDGGSDSGISVNHTYSVNGVYTATLTVTDNDGATAQDAVTVTVSTTPTDIVTITKAVYDGTKSALDVSAISTDGGTAILTLEGFGIMNYNSRRDIYSIKISNTPNPGTVTVDSSLGGSDTIAVTEKNGGGGSTNQAPTANAGSDQSAVDSDGNGFENITLDGSGSSDIDGIIVSYEWSEGATILATGQTATVSLAVGTHSITLTVTDDAGATGSDTVVITITTPSTGIVLSTSGYKAKGLQKVDLGWSGTTSATIDIYRNGLVITNIANSGSYIDNIDAKGAGSYIYKVCEGGSSTCSNESTVVF